MIIHAEGRRDLAATIEPGHHNEPLAVSGRRIAMIGIGGCGMSGLARLLRTRGAVVSGSDMSESPTTRSLQREGMSVVDDSSPLPTDIDTVIASAAIRPDHPQVVEARRRGLEVLNYAGALGRAMRGWTGVCVAGTHGKSTTTAMLGHALAEAGLDPSVIVGANCPQLGGGFRIGSARIPFGSLRGEPGLLIVEACEFNRSFLDYRPRVAAITSVEADHLDVYGSLDAVVQAFGDFARLLPSAEDGGMLLIAEQNAHRREVAAGVLAEVRTIGFDPSADWVVEYDPPSKRTRLQRTWRGETVSWVTQMPGPHNAMNAAMAAALAIHLGADSQLVSEAMSRFAGLDRRVQPLGSRMTADGGEVRVFDDYGHHPTEIESTLRALRNSEHPDTRGGRLICVFQPHQHSRTRFLLEEFAMAFGEADVVIVPEIYFVRDTIAEKQRVSSADLVRRLRERGKDAIHLHPFGAIVEYLDGACRDGDLVVVMGAGPVDEIARGFLACSPRSSNAKTAGAA